MFEKKRENMMFVTAEKISNQNILSEQQLQCCLDFLATWLSMFITYDSIVGAAAV